MKIEEIHIYTYHLPFLIPLKIGNKQVSSRSGVIIHIETNTSNYGFGEASPLPGLHQESLNDVKRELLEIKSLIIGTPREEAFSVIDKLQKKKKLSSCAQFALESAILSIGEQVNLPGEKKILPDPQNKIILINVLATGNNSSILKKIKECVSENYRSIKVKVGRASVEQEIQLLHTIRDIVGDKVTLRLDANQAWEFDEAVNFAKSVKNLGIEFIEEPLKNSKNLPALFEKTDLPIALDESLTGMSPESVNSNSGINTLVLKPSVIGSVRKTLRYINRAKKLGLRAIISDTFHTDLVFPF